MSTVATSPEPGRDPLAALHGPAARILVVVPLVALGDWLLRGPNGSALLLLVLGLAVTCLLTNPWQRDRRSRLIGGAALLLGGLPLVESFGILPLLFAFGGLAVFALLLTGQGAPGWLRKPVDAVRLLLSGPLRVTGDAIGLLRAIDETGWGASVFNARYLAGWIVPLGLLAVFGVLFADANPVFERWLRALDPGTMVERLEYGRVALWGFLLLLAWPFLHVRLARNVGWRAWIGPPPPRPADVPTEEAQPTRWRDVLLSHREIARSLVLFNLLFAVQTALDAVYLWGGAELPTGVTYASYAHRGAYPLIATALIAAGFVLVAMRADGPGQRSPLLRGLVHLFVAQNVALVLSSILRLDLYVSVYSLTYWRVAAFVWMGLVGIGLVLIAARIALRQSNRWLIGANLIAATATLYACCFVNFAALIAEYNVMRYLEGTNRGVDSCYLAQLGPQSIPAIDHLLSSGKTYRPSDPKSRHSSVMHGDLINARQRLASQHLAAMSDWRGWTLRDGRLSAYLAAHPAAAAFVRRPSPATEPPPAPSPAPVEPEPGPR